ncbi:hypothetical protein [Pengzhenrongella sp.]|jgi:hypothetical protein|uniref:hypothetical protein n=1 Tax=Pengzhenrongella sp. TaxID=2888820 RepID=UPI002F953003
MNAGTLLALARPTTRVDAVRTAIVAGCVAVALALVLVALSIVAIAPYSSRGPSNSSMATGGLSTYVLASGLQPGVVAMILVATLPLLALALQAIRLGSTDRTRRSGVLRVAGATPHQLRLVSAARSTLPIALGGLLAGPVHVVLWLLLGPALPGGSRFVPAPTARLALAWLTATVVVALVGAALGALDAADPPADTGTWQLGPIAGRAAIAVACCAMLVGGLVLMNGSARSSQDLVGPLVGGLLALALLTLGSLGFAANARRRARRLQRRGDAVAVLAAARVNADSAVLGRTGGTLFVAGVTLSVAGGLGTALVFFPAAASGAHRFYGTGIGATAVVVVLAGILAFASLVMSALDHVLTARRALATLAVLGGGEQIVRAAIATQFAVVAVPALTLGTALGGLAIVPAFGGWGTPVVIEVAVSAVVLCALARWTTPPMCRLAAGTVAPALREAMRAENLRAG